MKNAKPMISAAVLLAGVFAFSAPALADSRDRYRREYREDLRDLRDAHRELRRDLRRGAGPGEIARDRAAIARERREMQQYLRRWNDRPGWSRYGRYGDEDDRYRRGYWWNRWDRGWHSGWWR